METVFARIVIIGFTNGTDLTPTCLRKMISAPIVAEDLWTLPLLRVGRKKFAKFVRVPYVREWNRNVQFRHVL